MPTITNYGDSVTTGNTTSQGTGSSTFAGSLSCQALSATSLTLSTTPLAVSSGGTGLTTTSQNYLFAGPASGSGAPTFRVLVAGDLPASGVGAGGTVGSTTAIPVLTYDTYGRLTTVSTAAISTNPLSGTVTTNAVTYGASASTIQTAPGIVLTNPTASGTTVVLTCSGSLVASSGVIGTHYGAIAGSNTIAASSLTLGTALSVANGGTGLTSTSQNYLFAGPASGGSGAPTFRALAAGDLPASGVGAGATVGSTTAIPVLTYDTYGRLTAVSTASISTNPLSGTVTTSAVTYAASASTIQTAPGVVLTNPTASDSSVVLTCSGDIVAYSDRNIKTNIEQIPDALEKVLKIGGYTFNRKDGGSERRTGVIAQEVQAVLPEAVYKTDDGTLTVAYGNMVGLLIEAIKELQGSLDSAHKRITELENKFQS